MKISFEISYRFNGFPRLALYGKNSLYETEFIHDSNFDPIYERIHISLKTVMDFWVSLL